jgi:hypothetical protein
MICARCDEPIPPGQEQPVDKFSTSGAGLVLHVHTKLCPQTPTQTAPESPEEIRG